MTKYLTLYKEYNLHIFFEKLLTITIFLFIFSIPFNPQLGKFLINQMFYFWILSLQINTFFTLLKKSMLLKSLTLLMVYIYSSFLWSEEPLYNVNYIGMSLKFWFTPIVILVSSMKQQYIKYYISTFLFAMFINEIISYGMFFDLFHEKIFNFELTGSQYDPIPFQTSHMEYSVYISFTIFILLYSLFHKKWDIKSALYILFSLTMITNLFLSAGRSGQFTFLITSTLLIFIYFKDKLKYIFGSFLTLSLTFVIAYYASNTFHNRINYAKSDIEKAITEANYNTSFGVRISSYVLITKIIKEVPLISGVGFNDTNKVIHELHMQYFSHFPTFSHQQGHLHNTYLTMFTALGVLGLFLLLYIFYQILTLKIEEQFVNYIRYVFIFTIFFAGFTENMFREKEIMLLFATFFSIILAQVTFENKKEITL